MRTKAPPLLPIFRSRLQGELLAAVMFGENESESLTQLAQKLKADVATVQREVDRLERAGVLSSRRIGRARIVSADTSSPLYQPLAQLVLKTFGPTRVLAQELRRIPGIEDAYIFGSWASRYHGIEGPPPGDIDVLVIGKPDRDDLFEAGLEAERRLGREVSIIVRSKHAWEKPTDAFVSQIRGGPIVSVFDPSGAKD